MAPPFAVRWTDEPLGALAEPHVRVCKSQFVMSVFDGERCVKSYRVAVGAEPGHKQRQGDRRTPEGELRVCVKNPNSRYVLSLGLDYPNADDAARGLRDGLITQEEHDAIVDACRQGLSPPWNTALGGEIMIHGRRCGRDATLGCIAMDDGDILELYPRLPIGTPVTILP
jgi:murein L,D-transpeptidase YafK